MTFGGPIRRDRIHFFAAYEYEREPKTYYYTSPYPSFNVDVNFPSRVHKMMGRVDYQFTPQTRLAVRASGYNNLFYALGGTGSATTHPVGWRDPGAHSTAVQRHFYAGARQPGGE